MRSGLYFVLDGLDYSGKTSVLSEIARKCRINNIPLIETREPGGTSQGKVIRDWIMSRDIESSDALFCAMNLDRAIHQEKILKRMRNEKILILGDRSYYSTFVYNTNIDDDIKIKFLESLVSGYKPDVCFFLDVSTKEVLERIKEREPENHFDTKDIEIIESRKRRYYEAMIKYSEMYKIDANKSLNEVAEAIWEKIHFLVRLKKI